MYRRYQNWLLKRNLVYGGLLLVGAFVFLITLVIALAWVGGSPPWQARLFGVQTQAIVKSIDTTTCSDYTLPDPGLDGGGFVLGSLPHAAIENNVLPTVQFTDRQGHGHTVQENYCGNYGVGEQVTLWYVPNDPTTFALAPDTDSDAAFVYGDISVMLLSLLVALVPGIRFLIVMVRGKRANSTGNPYGVVFFQADSKQSQEQQPQSPGK